MSQNEPGLLEEFNEIVAATRSLLEADAARGVVGYRRLSRAEIRAAVAVDPQIQARDQGELPKRAPEAPVVSQSRPLESGALLELPRRAEVLVVGGICGPVELESGRPFLGEAGAMLEKMLTHVLGLSRGSVGLVMQKPARGTAVQDYRNAVTGAVRSVQPRLILAMGRVAIQALHPTGEQGIDRLGQWVEFQGIPLLPTLDPEHLLANPSDKRRVFADLKSFRAKLDTLGAR